MCVEASHKSRRGWLVFWQSPEDRTGAAQQEVLAAANGTLALSLFSSWTGRKQSSSGWLAVVLVCIFIVGFPGWTAPPSGTAMSCLEPNVTDGEKYTRQKILSVNGTECGLSVFHYSIWNRRRLLLVMCWFTNCRWLDECHVDLTEGRHCAVHAETASLWQWQSKLNSWDRRSKHRRSLWPRLGH